jgi:hypothetical protein
MAAVHAPWIVSGFPRFCIWLKVMKNQARQVGLCIALEPHEKTKKKLT